MEDFQSQTKKCKIQSVWIVNIQKQKKHKSFHWGSTEVDKYLEKVIGAKRLPKMLAVDSENSIKLKSANMAFCGD